MKLDIERGDRVFPQSGKAWDIANALLEFCVENGVKIIYNTRVTEILTLGDRVFGVKYINRRGFERKEECAQVILATGGVSYPATGSTGSGYEIIPSAWFDNLDRYRITAQLSTSRRGVCIVARSDTSADLKIERRDSAHYFINVPASATVDMDEGEIVLTIELRDTLTDAVLKAERRTIPLIKAREIRP